MELRSVVFITRVFTFLTIQPHAPRNMLRVWLCGTCSPDFMFDLADKIRHSTISQNRRPLWIWLWKLYPRPGSFREGKIPRLKADLIIYTQELLYVGCTSNARLFDSRLELNYYAATLKFVVKATIGLAGLPCWISTQRIFCSYLRRERE